MISNEIPLRQTLTLSAPKVNPHCAKRYPPSPLLIWFLDVSNGFEDVRQGSCDQVNDCDEGCGFAVSAGA